MKDEELKVLEDRLEELGLRPLAELFSEAGRTTAQSTIRVFEVLETLSARLRAVEDRNSDFGRRLMLVESDLRVYR